jgi:hypothetical protein
MLVAAAQAKDILGREQVFGLPQREYSWPGDFDIMPDWVRKVEKVRTRAFVCARN